MIPYRTLFVVLTTIPIVVAQERPPTIESKTLAEELQAILRRREAERQQPLLEEAVVKPEQPATDVAEQAPDVPSGPIELQVRVVADLRALARVFLGLGVTRARESEQAVDARTSHELRTAARDAFEQARAHLLQISSPQPVDLFRLARCEEKLGRRYIASELYAELIRRDTVTTDSGAVQSGPWARAARTARAVLSWTADSSDWHPVKDVAEIDWK